MRHVFERDKLIQIICQILELLDELPDKKIVGIKLVNGKPILMKEIVKDDSDWILASDELMISSPNTNQCKKWIQACYRTLTLCSLEDLLPKLNEDFSERKNEKFVLALDIINGSFVVFKSHKFKQIRSPARFQKILEWGEDISLPSNPIEILNNLSDQALQTIGATLSLDECMAETENLC